MKIFLTASLFFLLAPLASSQVWIDAGAVWHYDWDNLFGGLGFQKTEYVQDSTIDGQNCQMLVTSQFQYSWFGVPDSSTTVVDTNYTHVNGDTVFYYDYGEFFTLYNFGAIPGDSWIISTTNTLGECEDTSRLVVTDTGQIEIASTFYRYIDVAPTSNSSIGQIGRIVERFGNIGGASYQPHQWLFPSHFDCDSISAVVEWAMPSFKCFEDESFTLYNPSGEDCEYLATYYDLEELDFSVIEIYPDPTSVNLIFKSSTQFNSWQIFEPSGRMVLSNKLENDEITIDVRTLQPGLYTIVFIGEKYAYSRFVKN